MQGGRGGAVGARQLPGRRGQEGGRVLCEQHRPGAVEEVEQGVIDNMIVFQKPFPGAARTELKSQLQRAVKVKRVKCKMDLSAASSGTPPATACRAPRSSRAAGEKIQKGI